MPIDPGAIRWDNPAPAAQAPAPTMSAPSSGDRIIAPPDPYKQQQAQLAREAADRARRDQQIQEEKLVLDRDKANRDATLGTESERTAGFLATRVKMGIEQLGQISNPAAQAPTPGVEATRTIFGNTAANYITDADRQRVIAAQRDILDAALTLGTGAAYTQEQIDSYRMSYFPQLGDKPETIRDKEMRLRGLMEAARIKAGTASPMIDEALSGLFSPQDAAPANQAPPTFEGGGGLQPATGDTRRTVDQGMSNQLEGMLRGGVSLNEINGFLADNGLQPIPQSQYVSARKFLAKNPNYDGRIINAFKIEENSGFNQAATTLADNPVGAYVLGAGQFLSGNTLDNLTSDPERARASMDVIESRNPNATLAGNISGAVMGSLGGEAALARAGMAPGFIRGLAADVGFGAASGAGMADGPDQSRLGGAVQGAGAAALGNIAGNALVRGASRVIAPTGGGLNDLYRAGVNPTLGQRVADKGPVGAFVNKTEEAMQSLPIVGPAITSARQGARDEFQVGAFNEALAEVGEQLPKGMKPGTAPNAYAQKTFDRVYAEARKGMTLVVDKELGEEIAKMADDIATLGPEAQARLKSIMANRVNNKLQGGSANGDTYKDMMSSLGKQIAGLRKNPDNSELADVLTNIKFAIENAARRHSDPEAVQLLDAADAGYAKFVRVEDAARRRGGEAGTFTPNQLDAAVQNTSGGVRSKEYLRGEALMQDYASQGKALSDRLPNSGTIDRLTATRLGLGLLLSPVAGAYAPGVRKVVGKAMAPAGPKRSAIGEQLKKRAALAGKVGAASGVAALPGTSPGQ